RLLFAFLRIGTCTAIGCDGEITTWKTAELLRFRSEPSDGLKFPLEPKIDGEDGIAQRGAEAGFVVFNALNRELGAPPQAERRSSRKDLCAQRIRDLKQTLAPHLRVCSTPFHCSFSAFLRFSVFFADSRT